MNTLRIAGATVNQTPLDWSSNTSNIIHAIQEAEKAKVKIVCFPELCVTGYGCEDLFLSEWLSARAWAEIQKIRPHCRDIIACIGMPFRINEITYNGVAVVNQGKILGINLKQNLARDGVHYETRWFDEWKPGRTQEIERDGEILRVGDISYETEGISFGFEICEDAWRSVRPAENLHKKGVHLIFNASASHFALGKSETREKLVIDSSQKFNCAYLYVNLLGNEAGRMIYDGDIILAQHGKLLAVNNRLSFKPFNVLHYDIDLNTPSNNKPARIDDNKERNEELTQAITLALFDYLRKSKSSGFVISLSGGADSACCAVLVAEMIKRGIKNLGLKDFSSKVHHDFKNVDSVQRVTKTLLTCTYQASKHSSDTTYQAAKSLAESIHASFYHWSIQEEVDTYTKKIEEAIGIPTKWDADNIALQNIQARARSPIIWMLANLKKCILITTSNRSEADVGYATMDGDTSGSLAPIAGIAKPTILEWLKWAESELKYEGLQSVNKLQPTAELKPEEFHQTDEGDLMPYNILVQIEKHAIQHRRSPLEVFEQMKANHDDITILKQQIAKFFKLWAANQWKRERFAPSFHIDEINVDPRTWCRFPILSSGFTEELLKLANA